jgi:hypothetical protein
VARPQFPESLAKLVYEWCTVEQLAALLRMAKYTREEVRVSATTKELLIEKNLREAVETEAVSLESVYDLIREAEENGSQHIFYYKRAPGHAPLSLDALGSKLWGADWKEKMGFPRTEPVKEEFIFADLHPWNAHLKPHDWVLKIYGHEFTERPTGVVEEVSENRFKREFIREERKLVVVVRWNNTPGILELRIPQTESKKRTKAWLEATWLMIADACRPHEYEKWTLKKQRKRIIDEEQQNQKLYRCGNTRVLDGDHNVATFECHDPQGHLFASKPLAESVEKLVGSGECTHLRVTWLPGKNDEPSKELNTLLGHTESNEIVIAGQCSSRDVDYVTDKLRHFGR